MYESTTKKDRNEFVVAHLSAGKSLREVQDLLLKSGYGKIDVTRIWKIWRKSKSYVVRRPKEQFCSFCLENRPTVTMYSIVKNSKVVGRVCEDCWNKRPEQPIKQDGEKS